jgi:proline racemase
VFGAGRIGGDSLIKQLILGFQFLCEVEYASKIFKRHRISPSIRSGVTSGKPDIAIQLF